MFCFEDIAEIAPEHLRGAFVSANVLLITSGQFVSYVVDAALVKVSPSSAHFVSSSFVTPASVVPRSFRFSLLFADLSLLGVHPLRSVSGTL